VSSNTSPELILNLLRLDLHFFSFVPAAASGSSLTAIVLGSDLIRKSPAPDIPPVGPTVIESTSSFAPSSNSTVPSTVVRGVSSNSSSALVSTASSSSSAEFGASSSSSSDVIST